MMLTTLQRIWSQCTTSRAMNVVQFYSALRYISMAQHGFPISNLTPEYLQSCTDWTIGEPKFQGVDLSAMITSDTRDLHASSKSGALPAAATGNSDVEVKRIIWVELDGQAPEEDLSARRRALDERSSLMQSLRDEELKAMSELSNVEVLTKDVQLLELTLLKYRSQLESTSGFILTKHGESQKIKLQTQITDTKNQLIDIGTIREVADRRNVDEAYAEQNPDVDESLRFLRYCMEEALLQQMQTHDMLSRRIEERDALRRQVEEAHRAVLSAQDAASKASRIAEAEDLEKKRLLEQSL